MATPFAPKINIPSEVYPILNKIIKSGKSEKRLVTRALFIVRMGEGKPNIRIADEFQVRSLTVKKWRSRWLEKESCLENIIANESDEKKRVKELEAQVVTILQDKERPGTPLSYTAEQYCRILEVALESPPASGRPINDWTKRELAEEVNQRGICESISATQVGRFLKRSRPQTASSQLLVESESEISRRIGSGNQADL